LRLRWERLKWGRLLRSGMIFLFGWVCEYCMVKMGTGYGASLDIGASWSFVSVRLLNVAS